MKIKILFGLVLCLSFLCNVAGQEKKIEKADQLYKNYAFIDAIKTYEKVAEKGYQSVELFQQLGNSYYFNGELEKAYKWYEKLFDMNQIIDSEYYYRYSQTLKAVGNYKKANEMLDLFNIKKQGKDKRGTLYTENKDYLAVIKEASGRYVVDALNINSEFSDYGGALKGTDFVFASNRKIIGTSRKIQKWTNQEFSKLYVVPIGSEGKLGIPKEFSNSIDSKFNESTADFTKDGKTMYFTRNNFNNGKTGKNSKKVIGLKIYKAILKDGKWQDVTALSFNSDDFSTAHPALSVDEKTLYFSSDRPGTIGDSDLFKVQINANGTFGNPENLGDKINTEGKESFPFMSNYDELYFASDGHPGLGGLDIFVSKLVNNSFENAKNVGEPVNGNRDDFAFLINTISQIGFFSSNRAGGKGFDDIYRFKEIRKLIGEQEVYGEITDLDSKEVLPNAKVTLFDNKMNLLNVVDTDQNGGYRFKAECNKLYFVRAEKEEYNTDEKQVVIAKENGQTHLPMALQKERCSVAVGDDLGKCFGIKMIYFDLDKSNIRMEAALDLEKILDALNLYPSMKLDIRSHTDSRASFKYNESLSERRAKSTIDWLVGKGINPNRLTGKGYGELQLVNKCGDNVKCIEEEHQQNRRSEFIITAL